MLLGVKIKQPDERLDYDFIYDDWFGADIDSIDTVDVAIVGTSTMSAVAAPPEAQRVKVWLDGGDDGDVVMIEVTITTVAGRVKQDELEVQIVEY